MNYLQRKKQFFMSIVNQIKGFVRNISGTPPITLEDCADENSVIDYKIYGNSVQDGEPSPDNPIEVESVGEKTKNLFDKNNLVQDNVYFDASGELALNTNWAITDYIEIPFAASKLTVSIPSDSEQNLGVGAYMAFYNENKEYISVKVHANKKAVVTIPTGAKYFRDSIRKSVADVWQIEVGNTATEYEPYGYKIPVTARGKNLFQLPPSDSTMSNARILKNGLEALSAGRCTVYAKINGLEVGKKYTCKVDLENITTGSSGVLRYSLPNPNNGNTELYNLNGISTFTVTEDFENYDRLLIYGQNTKYLNIMIVEGEYTAETFPDYEPYKEPIITNIYLDEPLRKVGDYADYIDFKESKIYRYSAIKYITKDLKFSFNSVTSKNMYPCYFLNDMEKGINLPGYCNVLPANKQGWNDWTYPQVHFGQVNRVPYLIIDKEMTSGEDIYNYLSNNGEVEPYIIYIKGNTDGIIEPTETVIDLSNLPTFKGTTIYEINTTTQPSNMTVEYYSTAKGE